MIPAQGSHICINISGEMESRGGGATSADAQVQKRLGGSCTSARVPAGSCPCFLWLIKKQFCALAAGKKECSQTTRQAPLRARRLQTVMKTQPLQKSLSCGEESSTHPWGSLSLCISSCSFIFPLSRLVFFLSFTEITPILIKTGRKKLHKTLGGQNNAKDKGVE